MDYRRLYQDIIASRSGNIPQGYFEKHHILPRSLGGDNSPENLVALTAREHFICHYLLTKMYEESSFEWYKMVNAFMMMKASPSTTVRYFNGRLYEANKKRFAVIKSIEQSGEGNSQFGTIWIHNLELRESKKIPKKDLEKYEGWSKGRVINFDQQAPVRYRRAQNKLNTQERAIALYAQFKESGCSSVRKFSEQCDISHVALTKLWKNHVNDYAPRARSKYKP